MIKPTNMMAAQKRVRFIDAKLTADEKLLLLAGAVFTDLLYFETKASS
ncbi:hypothetical protein VB774_19425 [Pseudanabaena galeata UHCC 0370]|uniref:Uncharacterized protein n=1 Tax=Pseudanabaena galeata UHCC 0370 TaxID=3110310 RepID=A0ABU5TNC5_9CYAN|nr:MULTISPECIES: hypothetical protein [Pseudanabaena]MEA5479801.1 hypothetical protein [Pseudanabaena galeata UHCC 0370]WGS73298.1 hypothetical protein OA858_04515 [Pseudanabaena galeata CCNP1313]